MRNVHPPRSLWYPWLLLLFFLFFLGSREGKAEQPADSLFKALKSLEKGPSEERIKTLLNIGRALYSSYPDSAMSYVDQAEELAIKLDHRSGLIGSANLKGVIYYVQGKYPKALPYFQRVLEMKKEEGKAAEVANIRNNLGLLHQKMGAYAEALEEHQKAYQIRDSLNRPRGIAESCNNLGIVHYQKGDMEQAEAYYRRSIRIKKENGREGDLKGAYNNLGLVLVQRDQERKALELYRKVM